MIVDVPATSDDDRSFLTNLNGLVARLVSESSPDVVYAVRINKWFDHKWLRYSGKGRVAFDYGFAGRDTALDASWQDQLTFPPFNPKQVGAQVAWRRSEDGAYERSEDQRPLHDPRRRHSSSNLQNRVRHFTQSGLFVWFSGLSRPNKKASVMVYSVMDEGEDAWYASLSGGRGWVVERVKGIDRETVQDWFPLG